MRVRNAAFKARLVAICLMTLCSSTEASDDCSVADVLVDSWIRMARANVPAQPTTTATRTEREFKARDEVVLKGYSYSPPLQGDAAITGDFILLLQGSASSRPSWPRPQVVWRSLQDKRYSSTTIADTAGSTIRPTAASIQQDVDEIVDTLAEGGRRGVAIGLSLGGIFAIQSLKHSKSGNLRVLVDSVPAQVPRIPFLIDCPRWMNPLDAATETSLSDWVSSMAPTTDGPTIRRPKS